MSIYKYPQSKLVDEVTFEKSEGGQTRAYLHAVDGADRDKLQNIICHMAERDWQVTPYSIGGKPLLETHGFKSEKQLLNTLEQQGWATGEKQLIPSEKGKLGFTEQVKKRSLGASGVAYVAGDFSFAMYGYQDHNPWNLAAGILYGAGTASLLTGGRKDQSDLQIQDISRKMAKHFRDLKVEMPKDCSLLAITEDQDTSLKTKADHLLRRYPSELMNLFFAAAGACIAIAAYKSLRSGVGPEFAKDVEEVFQRQKPKLTLKNLGASEETLRHQLEEAMKKSHKRESWLDIGLGAMTGLSGLFAMSVKEKAHDPDEEKKKGLARAWEFIREKPLAIAGVGYMASTLCHAASTTMAWNYANNDRRKSVPWRATFVAANLIAEVLLAISSKGHGDGVKSDGHVDNTVISLASELIVKQPRAMQDHLIEHMAGFLGKPEVLAMKNDEAVSLLRQEVESMRNNPWAKVKDKDIEPQSPSPSITPAPEKLAWQDKETARAALRDAGSPHLSSPA